MLRAAALVLLSCGPAAAEGTTIPYSETHDRMNAAIQSAQATLPLFLEAALDPQGTSLPGFIVKVAYPTTSDPATPEHIWVAPFARLSDGGFTGFLNNDPADLGELEYGDQIAFSQDMVSDWTFLSERGLAYGQFTSRVIFEDGGFGDMPFDQLFEADPVPADWR